MALIKTKSLKGYDAEYWRVIQINTNAIRGDCVCEFALYKDEATRLADEMAVMETYKINLPDVLLSVVDAKAGDGLKAQAYKALTAKAIAEEDKRPGLEENETLDESLAFFADAVSDVVAPK